MNWKLFLIQAGIVCAGVGLAGIVLIPSLTAIQIPLIGGLTLLYLLITFHRNPLRPRASVGHDTPSISILICVVLLLILSTGKLSSLLFFLLYFLLFSISFVLLPEVVFVFATGILLFFVLITFPQIHIEEAVKLGSLVLFTPLAYFFGKIFQSEESQEKQDVTKITTLINAAEQIKSDVSEILLQQQAQLKSDQAEKLQDALEQSETVEKIAKE